MTTSPTYSDPVRGESNWYRMEYGSDGISVRVWLASKDDATYAGPSPKYDARCSWCWLGYAHSQAAHDARVPA